MQGLTPEAQDKIKQADQIIAAPRTIELFKHDFKDDAEVIDLSGKMMQLPKIIQDSIKAQRQVIVLATGDPLCHGIGSFLLKKLTRTLINVLPNLSMVQLAFSYLGESWQDAKICSVHTKDTGEWLADSGFEHGLYQLLRAIRNNRLLAVYTSPENSPQRIARMLIAEGLAEYYEFSIFEQLLQKDELFSLHQDVSSVAKTHYADLNIVIIQRKKALENRRLFGYPDDFYAQRKPEKGLITRRDIRAVVLAKMQLQTDSIVWDIGAGSGSVGLEAASICEQGYVHAIEKNCADLELILENRHKMQLINYSVVCAKAPDKMAHWLAPDAVFIGGSAGQLRPLIEMILQKLRQGGTLVMNFITLENLNESIEILKSLNLSWELTQLQASHSKPILHMNRLQSDNLVWIISVNKINNTIEI
ncbi:MAG: precorrin-6y C5,15-methyltransferase (decarboxylating) subunit CbiE [gamma proteobacterium symbiont of Bathyaustriella thionipta]|nr:precorrin-6y C5,15-methyltransferase (decarboxylating) subunit CbiE [gamma proteobacterium symbiont of Bathyaustriella thionipta]MCU7949644.1 precorrin-6y C5,15-methyltransferase (decarboxylating) subunit CbiE [gamma proteobacterium symbiont of Bathyaustriella thionipta]MCU7954835.1 precorrin-6y C5,15-methyltransferase (decarboxylating) subunit CbiE [gamma proteobacterium symbiont of Bathyaustriella thionipta]MCU7956223.1 precorrin-6y C5,15-methyltransferase (decarboxylating) subunit CbiE [ga